jgi:glycosyltransferase involved in cell wall biosynthesis
MASTAFSLASATVNSLPSASVRYLDDPALAARMGRAAAERARDFSPARFAGDVVSALRLYAEKHHPLTRRSSNRFAS